MRPLGRVSINNTLSGLNLVHGRAASSGHSTSLPFCLRFNDIVTDGAARLDTSGLAQAWLGGIRPRWMTGHFLFAPRMLCWLSESHLVLAIAHCEMPMASPFTQKRF